MCMYIYIYRLSSNVLGIDTLGTLFLQEEEEEEE